MVMKSRSSAQRRKIHLLHGNRLSKLARRVLLLDEPRVRQCANNFPALVPVYWKGLSAALPGVSVVKRSQRYYQDLPAKHSAMCSPMSVVANYPLQMLFEQYIPVSYTHLRAHETVLDLVC